MSLGLLTSSLRVLKNLKLKDTLQIDKVFGLVASKISDDDEDYSHIKHRKTKLQMVLLSAAVCGIEFCYAAETAFVSPTLLQIGVPVYYMTLIWCLSPMLGLILVPILGSCSDRCKSKLGRRRPFILLLSVGIIMGLLLVPNGQRFGVAMGDNFDEYQTYSHPIRENLTKYGISYIVNPKIFNVFHRNLTEFEEKEESDEYQGTTEAMMTTIESVRKFIKKAHPWSVCFTVLGVVLLDFSCDACQSPSRAYMLDVTVPEDHQAGLTTFTVLAGLGGSLGYILGGVDWGGTGVGQTLGSHIRVLFTIVLVIYIICVCLTMTSIKEVPLEKLGIKKEQLQKKSKRTESGKYKKFTNEEDDEYVENDAYHGLSKYQQGASETENYSMHHVSPSGDKPFQNGYQTFGNGNKTDSHMENPISASNETDSYNKMPMASEISLKTYLLSIVHMPKSLFILCLTNLFCWMSLVCYSLYFTDFVGQAVFDGDPSAPDDHPQYALYEEGVRMGSFAMSLYSLSCSLYSMIIERLVNNYGARRVYILSQLVYAVGGLLMAVIRTKAAVVLLSPCAGVMYATLFTMPYLLVAHYHSRETFDDSGIKSQEQQVRGLGTDIAVVSSMVFFAQFLLSLAMGGIIHAAGSTVAVMVCASVLAVCGSITATQVMYLDL